MIIVLPLQFLYSYQLILFMFALMGVYEYIIKFSFLLWNNNNTFIF